MLSLSAALEDISGHARNHRRDMQENKEESGETYRRPLYAVQSNAQRKAQSCSVHLQLNGKVQNFSYNIGLNDSFVLSDQTTPLDDTATSHVVQYINFDLPNRVLDFYEEGSGMKSFTFQCNNPIPTGPCITSTYPGSANLIFSGNTYTARIDANGNLAIDQNADGSINGLKINLVAEEGGKRFIIDLGSQQYSGNGRSITSATTPITFYQGNIISTLLLQRATIAGFSVILLQQATTPN